MPTQNALAALTQAACAKGQPMVQAKAADQIVQDLIGHKLFTLLFVDGTEVSRFYSSHPKTYPVSGRKTIQGDTKLGDLVFRQHLPYLGRTVADVRWAFADHALIESMGLGCVINLPVVHDGVCLGTMNILAEEKRYTKRSLAKVLPLAPAMIPAFLAAIAASKT
jgi:hypothetical protein